MERQDVLATITQRMQAMAATLGVCGQPASLVWADSQAYGAPAGEGKVFLLRRRIELVCQQAGAAGWN